jgi:hypothetical protein
VPFTLSSTERRAFERLARDLQRVFDHRFVALVASSATSSVAFAAPIEARDLDALSVLTHTWHQDGLDTPLLLTPDEFTRSIDAFPLEYQAVIDRHVTVAGTPPFAGIVIDPAHLRRGCEIQAKSHLIHLRQGWLEGAGQDDDLARLIAASAAPLRALLADVARLHGATGGDHAALEGARFARLPEALIGDVLQVETHPQKAHALVRRMPEYLAASEALWMFVDRWQV